jgi:SAM-dependent methyltransferase
MSVALSMRDRLGLLYDTMAFTREDESDDASFYAIDRMVPHLDSLALRTVERIVETLVPEDRPQILDLMASWDSHLPAGLTPSRLVGLGLNPRELAENPRLDERVIHDLNREPALPFEESSFDVVLNTVSVDYLTRPFEVFREVGRVLRPGGLFLVTFSNRMFPEKAVSIWRRTAEEKRVHLVEDFFDDSGLFGETRRFVQRGLPRPVEDRYAGLGITSDPVYAVYAARLGAERSWPSLEEALMGRDPAEVERVERRSAEVGRTLRCPHCEQPLSKWAVPQTPFTEWDNEHLHICFNDACPFLVRGWTVMARQGNLSFSYRLTYDPDRDQLGTMIVRDLLQLREHIVEE